jgi:hypothetical protein
VVQPADSPVGDHEARPPALGVDTSSNFMGLTQGWKKRALYTTIGLTPLVAALFAKMPICPTAALFHIPCPGCGLTRATFAALQGDFGDAFHFHPLVFIVTPIYLGVLGSLAWGYVRGGPGGIVSKRWNQVVTGLALFLFFALFGVWLARFFGAFGGPVPLVV